MSRIDNRFACTSTTQLWPAAPDTKMHNNRRPIHTWNATTSMMVNTSRWITRPHNTAQQHGDFFHTALIDQLHLPWAGRRNHQQWQTPLHHRRTTLRNNMGGLFPKCTTWRLFPHCALRNSHSPKSCAFLEKAAFLQQRGLCGDGVKVDVAQVFSM